MNKFLIIRLICITVLSGCLFSGCKKHKTFDLLPLKVGNVFYYKYNAGEDHGSGGMVWTYTKGTESWKIVSESSQGNFINYSIEIKMDVIHIGVLGDTTIISDSTRYIEINEDKSSSLITATSMIPLWNFPFKRYQDVSHSETTQECRSGTIGWEFLFKADSGLTNYSYCHPPIQRAYESLHLDSLRLIP